MPQIHPDGPFLSAANRTAVTIAPSQTSHAILTSGRSLNIRANRTAADCCRDEMALRILPRFPFFQKNGSR